MRAFVLVLDSVGIGSAPDAASYGDEGADTLGHIAEACARGEADRDGLRSGPLRLHNLVRLGLCEACRMATGRSPPAMDCATTPIGRYGFGVEISKGKDTPSGHWELAGVPVPFDWGYFPRTVPCFPDGLVDALCRQADMPGILGDCHASGTAIIAELGEEHIRTGKPICYTSADSVFQIAAHEESFGLGFTTSAPWRAALSIAFGSGASSPGRSLARRPRASSVPETGATIRFRRPPRPCSIGRPRRAGT